MGDLAEFVQEHPAAIGIAVVLVALLAFMSARNKQSSGDLQFTGGGVVSRPVDPGVVAMEQARISAGAENIRTVSSFILGEDTVAAQRDIGLASTAAGRDVSLAGIEAGRTVGLAQTEAGVTTARITADAATRQAQIEADQRNTAAHENYLLGLRVAD